MPCTRVGMAVVGLEVPHAHVHLMPINHVSDLGFGKSLDISKEELMDIANKIAANIE